MNARTKEDNTNRKRTIGKEKLGTHRMNDNGERMYYFCEHDGLVVVGNVFKHKDIHKAILTSPDG